jgi:hypothetical protein
MPVSNGLREKTAQSSGSFSGYSFSFLVRLPMRMNSSLPYRTGVWLARGIWNNTTGTPWCTHSCIWKLTCGCCDRISQFSSSSFPFLLCRGRKVVPTIFFVPSSTPQTM